MRDDLRGIARCPLEIADYLTTIGGTTPFNESMWRLVIARNVIWKVAGGKIWDENLSISERGGFTLADDDVTMVRSDNRPLRDESRVLVEQQRYPHLEGWILQRWFPPSAYSKPQWFAPENCLPAGTPKLGPFPQYGDYEMMAGPLARLPQKSELHQFISAYWRNMEGRTGSVESRMLEATQNAERQKQADEQRTRTFVDEYMRDKCSYLNSSSLEAGRIRTERAEKLGIREHVGS